MRVRMRCPFCDRHVGDAVDYTDHQEARGAAPAIDAHLREHVEEMVAEVRR